MKVHSGFLGRMLDVGDHSMERYVKHAKTWAEAAKAGAADVE